MEPDCGSLLERRSPTFDVMNFLLSIFPLECTLSKSAFAYRKTEGAAMMARTFPQDENSLLVTKDPFCLRAAAARSKLVK